MKTYSRKELAVLLRTRGISYGNVRRLLGSCHGIRPDPNTLSLVRDRSGGKCELCGITGRPLAVHHMRIDISPDQFNLPTNLLYLCRKCHMNEHHNTIWRRLMSNGDPKITVSFNLPEKLYEELRKRMPNYGDRTLFFRTVVERLISGELNITVEKKF